MSHLAEVKSSYQANLVLNTATVLCHFSNGAHYEKLILTIPSLLFPWTNMSPRDTAQSLVRLCEPQIDSLHKSVTGVSGQARQHSTTQCVWVRVLFFLDKSASSSAGCWA